MLKKTILSAVALAVVASSSAGLSTAAMAGYHADAALSGVAIEREDVAQDTVVAALNKKKLKEAASARKRVNRRRELKNKPTGR